MKCSFIFLMLSLIAMSTSAQQKQKAVKDTLPAKLSISNTNAIKKTKTTRTPEVDITEKLNNLVSSYINKPNTPSTWTQIKGEAQTILLGYFRNGILMGTKPEEAFFVKMGNETMTATDIANHKMVLHAGVAMVKPAEFKTIVVEKISTVH